MTGRAHAAPMTAFPRPVLVDGDPRATPRPRSSNREPELSLLGLAELAALASGADVATCRALIDADPWLVRLESTGPRALAMDHAIGPVAARRLIAAVALGRRLAALPAD